MILGRKEMCREGDSNPHGFLHTPLKRTCLPFHHPGIRHLRRIFYFRVRLSDSEGTVSVRDFMGTFSKTEWLDRPLE